MPPASGDESCHVVQVAADVKLTRASVTLDCINSSRGVNPSQDDATAPVVEGNEEGVPSNTDLETGISEGEASPRSGSAATSARNAKTTNSPPQKGDLSYDLPRVIFAFSLCCLSTIVSHIIRMPLFTTKIELQHSMNLTTLDLTHLDNFYAISHALGQMTSPALSSRSHSMLLITLHHFIIGVAISLLYTGKTFLYFTVVYLVTGFVTGPAWAILFTHLSAWLPEEHSFLMITLWFTCTDFGYIAGGLLCMWVQSYWDWRDSYIVSGILNILVAVMLFCLHDDCKQPPDNAPFIDPKAVIQKNIEKIVSFIHKVVKGDPKVEDFIKGDEEPSAPVTDSRREFILSGISNVKLHLKQESESEAEPSSDATAWSGYALSTYNKVVNGTRRYISVVQRVSYMGRMLTACFILRMVKHCFSSWVSFYVCTVYHYTVSDGSYVSFVIQLGNCIGNVVSAVLCRVFWKDRPLTACMSFFGLSAAVVLTFCLLDFSSVILYTLCCCLYGVVTSAAEAIMMAKGIKRLCDRSQLTQREFLTVYGFLLSTTTVGSITQGFLVAYVVEWYGWTVLFSLFVVALVCATALLFKPARAEIHY